MQHTHGLNRTGCNPIKQDVRMNEHGSNAGHQFIAGTTGEGPPPHSLAGAINLAKIFLRRSGGCFGSQIRRNVEEVLLGLRGPYQGAPKSGHFAGAPA
jgi:hypothetical protein